jgi:hypothetical protein
MLRWVRAFYFKGLPGMLVCFVLLLSFATTWALVLAAVALLMWVPGLVAISLQIRQEERRGN